MKLLAIVVGGLVGLAAFGAIMGWFMVQAANAELKWEYDEECHEANYGFEEVCEDSDEGHFESRAEKYVEYAGGGALWGGIGGALAGMWAGGLLMTVSEFLSKHAGKQAS